MFKCLISALVWKKWIVPPFLLLMSLEEDSGLNTEFSNIQVGFLLHMKALNWKKKSNERRKLWSECVLGWKINI